MRSSKTKALIRKIAKDEDLPIKQVEEIVNSFFHFTSHIMSQGDKKNLIFDSIRLYKFGIFRVKEGKRQDFERKLKKRDEKLNRDNKRIDDDLSGSIGDKGVQGSVGSGSNQKEGQSTEGTGLYLPFD